MIDLRSDTVTRPSDDMRAAAANAEVGDDVYGEDPTVNGLEARAADLLGTEAAVFCASGTMANQVAARTHTDRGHEILVEVESHIYKWELAGLAQHAGLQTRPIDAGPRGVVTPADIQDGYVEGDFHRPGTGLIALENTHNSRGGTAIAPEAIAAAADAAHERGVPVHLDGARLANAAVATNAPIAQYANAVDTVMLSLSKGLGAPVGSILAGSAGFIERARRVRKLMGGGMRQAGVIAAPARLALENIGRLAEDHENAAALAAGLAELPGLDVPAPETNIVLVDTTDTGLAAAAFLERASGVDVLGSEFDDYLVRLVTHRDIDGTDVATAVDRLGTAIN